MQGPCTWPTVRPSPLWGPDRVVTCTMKAGAEGERCRQARCSGASPWDVRESSRSSSRSLGRWSPAQWSHRLPGRAHLPVRVVSPWEECHRFPPERSLQVCSRPLRYLRFDVALEPQDPPLPAHSSFPPCRRQGRRPITTTWWRRICRAFGATQTTIGHVEASLETQGIRPLSVSANRLSIGVQADAGITSRAFSVRLRRFRLRGGRLGYANTTAPTLPASIGRDVQAVMGSTTSTPWCPRGSKRFTRPRRCRTRL